MDNNIVEEEFPEVIVQVAPIVDRARATIGKDHNRRSVGDFSEIFGQ